MNNSQKTPDQKFSYVNRLLVGLVVTLSLSLTAFEWTTVTYNDLVDETNFDYLDDDIILDPLRFRIEEAKKPEPVVDKKTTEIKIVKVLTEPDPEEPIIKTEPIPEPKPFIMDKGKYGMVDEVIIEDEILFSAEFFAHYDKCKNLPSDELFQCTMNDIINRIQKNFHIPGDLQFEGSNQTANMSFVVNKEGVISEIKVERTTHPSMGVAASKAIAQLPNMIPATQKGQKVSLRMNVPITLNMEP